MPVALADHARLAGLAVRGVMGYEGHLMTDADRADRAPRSRRHGPSCSPRTPLVGGDVISAGGTGTYDLNRWATEIQAGSYALMDTVLRRLGLPFRQALLVWTTVISVVAEAGWSPTPA